MLFLFRCGHKSKTPFIFSPFPLAKVIFFICNLEEKIEHFVFVIFCCSAIQTGSCVRYQMFTCSVLPCRKSLRGCCFV
ncbi:unnamed protein product [Brassica rapa subsp. trilocularis]